MKWTVKNTLLNNTCIKEEKSREIKYFGKNENTTYQNVLDIVNAENRGTFIALNTYVRKEDLKSIM